MCNFTPYSDLLLVLDVAHTQGRWEKAEKHRLQANQTREMLYQRRLDNEARRMEPHLGKSMTACSTQQIPFQVWPSLVPIEG